jgi:hypothetical protein
MKASGANTKTEAIEASLKEIIAHRKRGTASEV